MKKKFTTISHILLWGFSLLIIFSGCRNTAELSQAEATKSLLSQKTKYKDAYISVGVLNSIYGSKDTLISVSITYYKNAALQTGNVGDIIVEGENFKGKYSRRGIDSKTFPELRDLPGQTIAVGYTGDTTEGIDPNIFKDIYVPKPVYIFPLMEKRRLALNAPLELKWDGKNEKDMYLELSQHPTADSAGAIGTSWTTRIKDDGSYTVSPKVLKRFKPGETIRIRLVRYYNREQSIPGTKRRINIRSEAVGYATFKLVDES